MAAGAARTDDRVGRADRYGGGCTHPPACESHTRTDGDPRHMPRQAQVSSAYSSAAIRPFP